MKKLQTIIVYLLIIISAVFVFVLYFIPEVVNIPLNIAQMYATIISLLLAIVYIIAENLKIV